MTTTANKFDCIKCQDTGYKEVWDENGKYLQQCDLTAISVAGA